MAHDRNNDDDFERLISEAGKIGYPEARRRGIGVWFTYADRRLLQIDVQCPHCGNTYAFDVLKLLLYYVSGVLCSVCPGCRMPVGVEAEASPFVAMRHRLLSLEEDAPETLLKLRALYPEYPWNEPQHSSGAE